MMYAVAVEVNSETNLSPVERSLSRNFPDRIRVLPHLWIVEGSLAAEQIRSGIEPLLGAQDRLVVIKTAREALSHGLPGESVGWLKEHFPDSMTDRIP
jgi:hypothetical protein